MTEKYDHLKGIGGKKLVGATLRGIRGYYNIKQSACAAMLGKDPTILSRIENGTGPSLSRDEIKKIGEKSGIERSHTDELLIAAGYMPTSFDRIVSLIETDEDSIGFRHMYALALSDLMEGKVPSVNIELLQHKVQSRMTQQT